MRRVIGLLIAMTAIGYGRSTDASVYVHPAGAWRMEGPAGWPVKSLVDPHGYPLHVFTPDPSDDFEAISRGIWVFAIPIPTDESLESSSMSVVAATVLTTGEPELKTEIKGDAALGKLKATMVEVTGRRKKSGDWRGRLFVSVQNKEFLAVFYGGPPAEWEAISKSCEAALKSFDGPTPLAPRAEPPMPKEPQRARDISDQLTAATPMIHILAHTRDKEPREIEFATATGFIVSEDGYMITNRHVVADTSTDNYERESFDPMKLTWDQSLNIPSAIVDVVAVSYREDVALLKIRKPGKWTFVPLVDSGKAKKGDKVVVVGWPDPTVVSERDISQNEGSLTGIDRDLAGRPYSFRHSARTTAGNSGGPLYDLELGGVIAAHNEGLLSEAHGFKDILAHRSVPSEKIVLEFPQILGQNPDTSKLSIEDRRALVAYYFLQERYGAGVIEAKAALAQTPNDPILCTYLYRMDMLLGRPSEGEEMAAIGLMNHKSELLATFFVGRALNEMDDYKGALAMGQNATKLAPNDPEGYLITGEALGGMGRFDEAFKSLDQAMKLSKGTSPEAYAAIGALTLGQWMGANQVTELPAKVKPPADVLASARKSLERSIALWPARNGISQINLAIVAALEGKGDEAEQRYQLAKRMSRGDADTLVGIAWFELLCGRWQDGQKSVGDAMAIRQNGRSILFLGWSVLQQSIEQNNQGKQQDAAATAKRAGNYYLIAAKESPDAAWAEVARNVAKMLGAE